MQHSRLCYDSRLLLKILFPMIILVNLYAASPLITNLDGESVSWAGEGNSIKLDSGNDATVSDSDFDTGDNWNGATLSITRKEGTISNDVFSLNTTGSAFTLSGPNIQSGGSTFATYTNTGGQLDITFNSSGTNATNALVQNVLRNITYQNDTPFGDTLITFSLNDGSTTVTADVNVTSSTLYVDQTAFDEDNDTTDGLNLAEAINLADTNDTIRIKAGNYRGQFVVDKALTIEDAGDGTVTLEAPDETAMVNSPQPMLKTGINRIPIIDLRTAIEGEGEITLKNVTIDGRFEAPNSETNASAATTMLIGIGVFNTNAIIDNVHVKNISTDLNNTGYYSGVSSNFGILIEGNATLSSDVNVTLKNSQIEKFQKTGIIAWGSKLNVTIQDNNITASGFYGLSNQNGMQIGSAGDRAGTKAIISGNIVSDIGSNDSNYNPSGIMLVQSGTAEVSNNKVFGADNSAASSNTVGIYLSSVQSNAYVHDNNFSKASAGIVAVGNYSVTNRIENNDFSTSNYAVYALNPNQSAIKVKSTASTLDNGRNYLYYILSGKDDNLTDTGNSPTLVNAGSGNDIIIAGDGNDTIYPGDGNDTMTGNDGNDTYIFSQTDNLTGDRITDFGTGDRIRLSGVTLTSIIEGDGTGITSTTAHYRSYRDGSSKMTTLYLDDANATTDSMEITLDGNLSVYLTIESGDIFYLAPELPSLSPTNTKGTVTGSTILAYTSGSGNSLKYMFSNTAISTPTYGDNVPLSAVDYSSGSDITGAVAGKYLILYEVDESGSIVGFTQILLTSDKIKSAPADTSDNNTSDSGSSSGNISGQPKLVSVLPDQLIDVNNTSAFDFNVTSYFSNITTYSARLRDGSAVPGWLQFSSGTFTTDTSDHNASILGRYYIKVTGTNSSTDINATGYFTLRVKDINSSTALSIPNTLIESETSGTDDARNTTYIKKTGSNFEVTEYADGGTRHIAKDNSGNTLTTATSYLPDSNITVGDSGDVNTSVSTIDSNGNILTITVEGLVSGNTKAIHLLELEDGNITKASSKLSGSSTVIGSDKSVETNATYNSVTLSVRANSDGTATHIVKTGSSTTRATVSFSGGITTIGDTGEIDTAYRPTLSTGSTSCGTYFEAAVVTESDGTTVTKFRDTDGSTECSTSTTLLNGESFPAGSESNITTLDDSLIHILTTTPSLESGQQFDVQ